MRARLRRDAGAIIERIADDYEHDTGYRPYVFSGSSPGALASGARTIVL